MSKVYVTGDIHGGLDIAKLNSKNFSQGKTLTKDDYVIVCGDFGLIFSNEQSSEEKYWLDWLNNKKWTTLFIDGNHDNIDKIRNDYPNCKFLGAKCQRIKKSVYHIERGEIISIDDKKIWCMGGAFSHDLEYRTVDIDWWADECPSPFDKLNGSENLNLSNWNVDYIITHSLPSEIVTQCFNEVCSPDALTDYLSFIDRKTEFKKWYTGHYHMDANIYYNNNLYVSLYNKILQIGEDCLI